MNILFFSWISFFFLVFCLFLVMSDAFGKSQKKKVVKKKEKERKKKKIWKKKKINFLAFPKQNSFI